MTKIQHAILVWLLACAGLLIAVLYSPVGSPDFYESADNRTKSLNFEPINGVITNSPKTHAVYENSQDELILPDLSFPSTTNRSIANTGSKKNYSNGSFNRSVQLPSSQNSNSTSTGNSGSPFLAGGRSHNSDGSSAIMMTNGITTLSMTSEVSNTISKQNAADQTYTADGNSDPGDNPYGDPIPVGDGWGLLVFLGVCYGFFKRNSK